MFERVIAQTIQKITAEVLQDRPQIPLHDIRQDSRIPTRIKPFFDTEVHWWLYNDMLARAANKRFDYENPELTSLLNYLEQVQFNHAVFEREEFLSVLDSAVKLIYNYLCRPQTTLKWYIFRGQPVKPLREVMLRFSAFVDYGYFPRVFMDWVDRKRVERSTFDAISATEFERVIRRIDDQILLNCTVEGLLEIMEPLFDFIGEGPKQLVPVDALIIFFDDKNIKKLVDQLEASREKGLEYVGREDFVSVLDELLSSAEEEPEADYSGVYQNDALDEVVWEHLQSGGKIPASEMDAPHGDASSAPDAGEIHDDFFDDPAPEYQNSSIDYAVTGAVIAPEPAIRQIPDPEPVAVDDAATELPVTELPAAIVADPEPEPAQAAHVPDTIEAPAIAEAAHVPAATEAPAAEDVPDTAETVDVAHAADATEAPVAEDVPGVAEESHAVEAAYVADATETRVAEDVPGVAEGSHAVEVAHIPDATEAPVAEDVPGVAEESHAVEAAYVADATETPSAAEAAHIPDAIEVPEVVAAAQVPDVVEVPDAVEASYVPDAIEAPEVVEATQVPDVVEVPDAVEAPDVVEAVNVPDTTEVPDAVEAAHIPDAVEAVPIPIAIEAPPSAEATRVPVAVEAMESIADTAADGEEEPTSEMDDLVDRAFISPFPPGSTFRFGEPEEAARELPTPDSVADIEELVAYDDDDDIAGNHIGHDVAEADAEESHDIPDDLFDDLIDEEDDHAADVLPRRRGDSERIVIEIEEKIDFDWDDDPVIDDPSLADAPSQQEPVAAREPEPSTAETLPSLLDDDDDDDFVAPIPVRTHAQSNAAADIPQPANGPQPELSDVRRFVDAALERKVVKKIFGKDRGAYEKALEAINAAATWRAASQVLDGLFIQYGVDPYSRTAIRFTDSVYGRYLTKA